MCDLQHFATVLVSFGDVEGRSIDLTEPFDPKYESMIVADGFATKGPTLIGETEAKIIRIRKSSPLTIVIGIFCSASSVALVTSIAKTACRIIIDLQKIKRARFDTERAGYKAISERLRLDKAYSEYRSRLKNEDERETLDQNVAVAIEALVDGRYPPLANISTKKPES